MPGRGRQSRRGPPTRGRATTPSAGAATAAETLRPRLQLPDEAPRRCSDEMRRPNPSRADRPNERAAAEVGGADECHNRRHRRCRRPSRHHQPPPPRVFDVDGPGRVRGCPAADGAIRAGGTWRNLAAKLDRGSAASRVNDARAVACPAGRQGWRSMALFGVMQMGGCISACWTGAARAWHKRVAVPWCLRDGLGAGNRERM